MRKSVERAFHTIANWVASRARGEEYHLDPSLPMGSFAVIVIERGLCALRGLAYGFGRPLSPGTWVYVGSGVKLRNRRLMRVSGGVTFGRGAMVDALSRDGISLGRGVTIGAYSIIATTGVASNLGVGLEVGDNSAIGSFSCVGAAGGVRIGRDVLIGNRVGFHSENHEYSDTTRPIRAQGVRRIGICVEDDCWIGAGAILLDGCRIGHGSVIGAGSVVRGEIPPLSIAVGVPARVIGKRSQAVRGAE